MIAKLSQSIFSILSSLLPSKDESPRRHNHLTKIYVVTVILYDQTTNKSFVNVYVVLDTSTKLAQQQALNQKIKPLPQGVSISGLKTIQILDNFVQQHEIG